MALLDNTTQKQYYEEGNHGSYQFVSLADIVDQFMAVYVGEEKLIDKANRLDVSFWAQRALAELSFDTLKSFKSQEIVLPPSLQMILPHDYVNYTKLSYVDSAGIKHPLYYAKDTNNPFHIRQVNTGEYDFPSGEDILINSDFDDDFFRWNNSYQIASPGSAGTPGTKAALQTPGNLYNYAFLNNSAASGSIALKHQLTPSLITGSIAGSSRCTWQKIDVSNIDYIDISGFAATSPAITGNAAGSAHSISGQPVTSAPFYTVSPGNFFATDSGNSNAFTLWSTYNAHIASNSAGTSSVDAGDEGDVIKADLPATTARIGISTSPGDTSVYMTDNQYYTTPTRNSDPAIFNLSNPDGPSYLEWTAGEVGVKEMYNIDVRDHDTVYLLCCSIAPWETAAYGEANDALFVKVQFDDLSVYNSYQADSIQERPKLSGISSTWEKYKATTSAELNNDDYEDYVYWPNEGERYGLEPSHAQVNGSFYIDDLRGKIHFSSNISGKNVILDYISDSLGTEDEMKVHKLAEEAMYRWITHGVLSTKRNIPEYVVMRAKKEKFAATRQAKLRLSNLKIEDLTRMLRGKSKQIKH